MFDMKLNVEGWKNREEKGGEGRGEGGKKEELPFTSLGRVGWKSKTSRKCKEMETN